MVKSLKKEINALRDDKAWDLFLQKGKDFGESLNFDMQIPLRRMRKISCRIDETPNTHYDNQDYNNLKVNMYFPVIDKMIQELDLRFPEALIDFAFLEPKNMHRLDAEEHILNLSKRYNTIDSDRVLAQYKITRNCVKNTQTILEVLSDLNPDYKDLIELYKICLCLPVTTASVERSFSKLTMVKIH